MRRILVLAGALGLAVWACVEEPTAPSRCPDFCPSTKIVAIESLLTSAISRDSTFEGYVLPQHAGLLPATAEGGIDSRPISRMVPFSILRQRLDSTDTTTGAIVPDSMKLTIHFLRPDTGSRNLRFSFYQLPDSIDSTTTFADLVPAFSAPPLRVVNVDSLLRQSSRRDTILGDTVLADGITDSVSKTSHIVTMRIKFDSAHAPFNPVDSGRFSLGVVVSADNKPTAAFGSAETPGLNIAMSWFYRVDSAGKLVRPDSIHLSGNTTLADSILIGSVDFDSFVYNAPAIAPDSNLLIGGVPSRRSLLRIDFPKQIRDSSQVLRAQLLLVPTATAPLETSDSIIVAVKGVATDLGLKSPFSPDTIQGLSTPFVGNPDTLRIELTSLFRFWQFDTTQTTSVYVRLLAFHRADPASGDTTGHKSSIEGGTFTTLRLFSSRTPAFRPMIRLTYVPRIRLGAP